MNRRRRPFQGVNNLYLQLLTRRHKTLKYAEIRVRRANHGWRMRVEKPIRISWRRFHCSHLTADPPRVQTPTSVDALQALPHPALQPHLLRNPFDRASTCWTLVLLRWGRGSVMPAFRNLRGVAACSNSSFSTTDCGTILCTEPLLPAVQRAPKRCWRNSDHRRR